MFSLSNIENAIKAEFIRTEAAVERIVTHIANDVEVSLADLHGAGNYLAAHAPQIAAGIVGAATFAIGIGVPISPALLMEVKAASTALTAFAEAHNAGKSTPKSVVEGYVAYTTAAGLIPQAKAAAIVAKTDAVLKAIGTAATKVSSATSVLGSQAAQATSTAAQAIVGAVADSPAVVQ